MFGTQLSSWMQKLVKIEKDWTDREKFFCIYRGDTIVWDMLDGILSLCLHPTLSEESKPVAL